MTATLDVLICDDESIARKRLLRLLSAMSGVNVIAECSDGREVLEYLEHNKQAPDVLLLDIRMPDVSGLETSALLPEDGPYVIFVTAHSEHALEAFEVGADDYLLKPIEMRRLHGALERARLRLGRTAAVPQVSDPAPIGVETKAGIVLVQVADLSHATYDGELTTLHTKEATILSDSSLQQLQERLPDAAFWRVHRRVLINLNPVTRLEPNSNGGFTAHMKNGDPVPVSRQAGRRLRRHLTTKPAPAESIRGISEPRSD
jgi:two-component system LytT family response regulator